MKNEKVYVFGHKKPDTDSVCASIALAYLKKELGMNASAYVLGDINNESKFVLDYFKVDTPEYLNSVKLQIKDVNYRHGCILNHKESIIDAFNYMTKNAVSSVPVVDDNNKFDGVFAMKDIARNYINENMVTLKTSYDNILKGINGKEILRFDEEISGKVLSAAFRSTTFIENVVVDNNTILIIGDRHSIIEYAINNGAKLLIITSNADIKPELIEMARNKKINIIQTKYDSSYVTSHISLTNYIKSVNYTHEILCFNEDDDVTDLIDAINKTKFSYYPITNEYNECLGLLKTADLNDKTPKKVIMVDHQEYSQSVDGIEEAEILEIVDHHKIGATSTSEPIYFLNKPIGSSNTIIYNMYKEYGIEIPRSIAGLMMSGIISDTLLLKSPTTTKVDETALQELSEITNINYDVFGNEMFKAGSELNGKTAEEIIYMDYKVFGLDKDQKMGIGQVTTLHSEEVLEKKDEFISHINNDAKNNNYLIVALFVSDIMKEGSYVFFNESAKSIMESAFGIENIKEGEFLPGYLSRKKQIVPNIMKALEK